VATDVEFRAVVVLLTILILNSRGLAFLFNKRGAGMPAAGVQNPCTRRSMVLAGQRGEISWRATSKMVLPVTVPSEQLPKVSLLVVLGVP
jgi:hypothetical protein